MSLTATKTIQDAANATSQLQAKTDTVTGAASAKMTSTQFMNMLLKQLQYQDPMSPTDNNEFVSQQCQFSQLSATEEMNNSITQNNTIMQTLSLIGKNVTLQDPSDLSKTISGNVTSANFTQNGSTIEVGGKSYPIALIKKVQAAGSTTTPTT